MKLHHILYRANFLILIFCVGYAYAAPIVGTTQLTYAKNAIVTESCALQTTPPETPQSHPDTLPTCAGSKSILSQVKLQLTQLQPRINQQLNESGQFSAFNAESIVASWQRKNPNFLSALEMQSNPSFNESSAHVNHIKTPNISYVLLGWIKAIKVSEERATIMDTGKVSILYSIDIIIDYKVINQNTRALVTEFVAMGHGGIARIMADSSTQLTFNTETMINNAIGSLTVSVKHGLLIKQSQGIILK